MKRFLDFVYSASVRQWAMILAGVPLTCNLVWVIYLIRNGWDSRLPVVEKQLTALTWIAYLLIFNIILIIVALTSTKFKASGLGGSIDVGEDGDYHRNTQIQTTQVSNITEKINGSTDKI